MGGCGGGAMVGEVEIEARGLFSLLRGRGGNQVLYIHMLWEGGVGLVRGKRTGDEVYY